MIKATSLKAVFWQKGRRDYWVKELRAAGWDVKTGEYENEEIRIMELSDFWDYLKAKGLDSPPPAQVEFEKLYWLRARRVDKVA